MSSLDSVRLLELLASKICHDLISPVGAVSNGVEILEEMGADAGEDVVELIAFSALQANAKLKALRMAYGLGGADESIKPEDVHTAFGDFIAGDKRVSQNWDPHTDLGIQNCTGFSKVLICLLIFASEALPKGGEVSVQAGDAENTLIVVANGENASFRDGFVDALNQDMTIEALDNKFVHAYLTGLLIRQYDFEISTDESQEGFITLRLTSSHVS